MFAVAASIAATSVPLSETAMAAPAIRAVPIGNFENPVHVAVAPGQPRLLFVVERPGKVRILQDDVTRADPFLDIRDLVRGVPDSGAGGEEGLLSVAFHPLYSSNGRFYVVFTNNSGDVELNEFRRSTSNGFLADRATRRVVLTIPHPVASNHNGGQLQFGPDGLLYVSIGDGGNVSPTGEAARNLESLLGKVLRIDPLPVGSQPYRIPANNPFVGRAGRDEIFAYGFRNPWRFSFDQGAIAIADVGQRLIEEINVLAIEIASGTNFGWPQYEGKLVFDAGRPGAGKPYFPIFSYDHTGGRCAIVGGYVVRDATVPSLHGRYLYGDACTGELRSLIVFPWEQRAYMHRSTEIVLPGLSSFGEGFGGQIYAAQINGTAGTVSRIEKAP